jgi:hypothetical protein
LKADKLVADHQKPVTVIGDQQELVSVVAITGDQQEVGEKQVEIPVSLQKQTKEEQKVIDRAHVPWHYSKKLVFKPPALEHLTKARLAKMCVTDIQMPARRIVSKVLSQYY